MVDFDRLDRLKRAQRLTDGLRNKAPLVSTAPKQLNPGMTTAAIRVELVNSSLRC